MSELSTRTIVRTRKAAASMRIVVTSGPSAGASATGHKIVVGRSRVADVILEDFTVSEFHVEISAFEDGIEVRDLDSHNGTYCGDIRVVRGFVPIGTMLHVGESTLRIDRVAGPEVAAPVRDSFGGLLGTSVAMRNIFATLARLAPTELAAFVEGPTGSGKELVARALHDASPRASGPFVVLDCAALPPLLAESVLFGHERGAFTGAVEAREGVFEAAHGGTVFLDEVGELPLELQPRLLRVLEQRQVTRVGANRPRDVSVRVVSATWRDLRRMVNQGQFRDDLYFRLAQVRVVLPSLSERPEDIEPLALHFLRRMPPTANCARSISREAIAELRQRDFPGNVRELKNVIDRASYMAEGDVIRPSDIAFERILERAREVPASDIEVPEFKGAKRTAVDDFERDYLARLMKKTNGNISMAAGLAGIERHYLRSLLKRHGLHNSD